MGDWTLIGARYRVAAKTVSYEIHDRTVVAAKINPAKYRNLKSGPLLADVCRKQTTFKKYSVDVVYKISGKLGKLIADFRIDTANCK